MNNDIYSSIKKYSVIAISICLIMLICYIFEYSMVYRSIKVTANSVNTLEYGSSNYDIRSLVRDVDGEVLSVKKDIDTNVVGKQEMVVVAKKGEVTKEIALSVEVKDTIAPEIKIKEENISLTVGEDFDVLNNLESVADKIDGNIEFLDNNSVNEEADTNYYTVYSEVNNDVAGVYPVTVKAVDKYGNLSSITYNVEVVEDTNVALTSVNNTPVVNYNNDYIPTGDVNSLVDLAYSLVGSRYVAGGASPDVGFDCSGFVHYLYSRIGINISRSSSTQMYEGVAVSYDQAMPGDILSWGYVDGSPTHSALYIGNGQMIHATNPSMGVIVSDVASWTRGSGTHVIAVRRI